jgi:hypothetical protein
VPAAEQDSPVRVTLGLVATRGSAAEVLDDLADRLRVSLPETLSDLCWDVRTTVDNEIVPPVSLVALVDQARRLLLAGEHTLLVLITDLPLIQGRSPVLAHASRSHQVGVVSIPAHGARGQQDRTASTLLRTVNVLLGGSPDVEAGGGRRTRVRHRALLRPRRLGSTVSQEPSSVAFGTRVVAGNLRLIAGMVRANQPWRLALHLTRALTAALATGILVLVTTDITWRLADRLGVVRLAAIGVSSVVAIGATLIIGAGLWERHRSPEARQQVLLFNVATTLTVMIGVTALFAMLVVLTGLGVALFLPSNVVADSLGHGASWGDRGELAWLAGSVATLGGALGAGLESDDAVRQAAYIRRRQQE